ncbi:MAG: hypothetical protein ACRECV_01615 [Xanthobacteraceae bacterium]
MSPDDHPSQPPAPIRASRWSASRTSPASPYRQLFRFLGLPIIAVGALILYRGFQDRFALPACDSDTAKRTLARVLKELKLEPVHYAPIKTISSSNDKVVCNATMPLPGGGNVVADYTFYWQGSKANMRYSIHREAAKSSALDPMELARDF